LPAERLLTVDAHAYERVHTLDETGCAIVIGFPRYLNELGDLIQFSANSGKQTIVITDSPFSPFHGDITLFAPVESSSFIAFHSAPLILISTLMAEIANDCPERTLKALDHFEELAEGQDLFKTS
jgi:DNA-binding MurR/RpiR family transcriptional regulator